MTGYGALASCSSRPEDTCHSLELKLDLKLKLEQSDPSVWTEQSLQMKDPHPLEG